MTILIDYDNLEAADQLKGLHYIADQISSSISPIYMDGDKRINLRLYGGWYTQDIITIKAQQLETEILECFPIKSLLSDMKTEVIVNCQMAYSTLAEPSFHLLHTFREKSVTQRIYSKTPSEIGCSEKDCVIETINQLLNKKKCPKCGNTKLKSILYKKEQKLVDSMIITDLLTQSLSDTCIGLVSSDDDCWPGIRAIVAKGCKIIHIKSKDSTQAQLYTKNINSNYIHKNFNYGC